MADIDVDQVRAVAAFFGWEQSVSSGQIERILGMYSKDPGGARPFQPDGARKQRLAAGLILSAAYQWVSPVCSDLKKRCF